MRKTTTFFVTLAFLLPAAPAAAAGDETTISNFSFSPSPVRIAVGATLKWTNLDSSAHTVTADDGSWTSTSLNKDGTFSHAFNQPGTVRYHCAIHESMTGTVEVGAATPTTAAAPEDTTATTQAALNASAGHDADGNATLLAIGAALILLGGAAGWWALRHRRSATG